MKQRLINCDFLYSEAFNDKISNKAKLLYFTMFIYGDDKGFVGNTNSIIEKLKKNDDEFTNQVNLSLIENDYNSALLELINMGFIYEFRDNHNNRVHLIRHWFIHNKWRKGLSTNYGSFLKLVDLVDYKYVLKESSKEIKLNESKINEIKLNTSNDNEETKEDNSNVYSFEDFLRDKGVSNHKELTPEQIEEWRNICINGL